MWVNCCKDPSDWCFFHRSNITISVLKVKNEVMPLPQQNHNTTVSINIFLHNQIQNKVLAEPGRDNAVITEIKLHAKKILHDRYTADIKGPQPVKSAGCTVKAPAFLLRGRQTVFHEIMIERASTDNRAKFKTYLQSAICEHSRPNLGIVTACPSKFLVMN